MAIGIAILGAGVFAQDGAVHFSISFRQKQGWMTDVVPTEHLPAIRAWPDFCLKAIYSRSQISAQRLATEAHVDPYFDRPEKSNNTLSVLLARTDIQAVTIALPTSIQPSIIRQALEAGKHVLSEKPIANDVESAQTILEWYTKQDGRTLWSVGESIRFMDPVLFGRHQLKEMNGNVETFSVKLHAFVEQGNRLSRTTW